MARPGRAGIEEAEVVDSTGVPRTHIPPRYGQTAPGEVVGVQDHGDGDPYDRHARLQPQATMYGVMRSPSASTVSSPPAPRSDRVFDPTKRNPDVLPLDEYSWWMSNPALGGTLPPPPDGIRPWWVDDEPDLKWQDRQRRVGPALIGITDVLRSAGLIFEPKQAFTGAYELGRKALGSSIQSLGRLASSVVVPFERFVYKTAPDWLERAFDRAASDANTFADFFKHRKVIIGELAVGIKALPETKRAIELVYARRDRALELGQKAVGGLVEFLLLVSSRADRLALAADSARERLRSVRSRYAAPLYTARHRSSNP